MRRQRAGSEGRQRELIMANTTSNPKVWRKRPKQNRSSTTVVSILDAAEEMFASKGYNNTTSEDIVRRAGVGIGSLYDYFPNKTSIALALLENTSTAIADDSRKIFVEYGSESIETSLPKVIREIYKNYKRHKNVLISLVNEVPELRSTSELYSIDRLIHRASRIYLQMYEDQYADKDIRVIHEFLNLLFTASIKHYLAEANPPLAEETFLDNLTKTILFYLTQHTFETERPKTATASRRRSLAT